jgi:hypothetical protein
MRYAIFPTLATLLLCLALQGPTLAHCEVPCGIYGDQQRFEAMLEDHKTVLKAMTQIQALAGKEDAQSHNQLARWVANKESHATKIQHAIAQYFMAQRIKASDPKYVDKLTKAQTSRKRNRVIRAGGGAPPLAASVPRNNSVVRRPTQLATLLNSWLSYDISSCIR